MQITALILNFIGVLILTFSTGNFFKWIGLALNAHEMSIQSILSKGPIYNVAGTTKHLDDTLKASGKWMIIGFILVIIGFGLQIFVEYQNLFNLDKV
jgi:hypothetical protein